MLGFRVWDVENKCWHDGLDVAVDFWGSLCTPNYEGSFDLVDGKLYIPMQSTGMKDKNGKEIFEGDALRVTLSKKSIAIYVDTVFDFLRQAGEWDHVLDDGENPIYFEDCIEVIGNIWETPGLRGDE